MSRRTKRKNPLRPLRLFRVDLGLEAYARNNRWRWKLRSMIRDVLHVPLSEAGFADVWVALRFRGLP